MVPPIDDPKWEQFLNDLPHLQAQSLAARMLINRLKLKVTFDTTLASRREAKDAAHAFFTRNERAMADDIRTIFA